MSKKLRKTGSKRRSSVITSQLRVNSLKLNSDLEVKKNLNKLLLPSVNREVDIVLDKLFLCFTDGVDSEVERINSEFYNDMLTVIVKILCIEDGLCGVMYSDEMSPSANELFDLLTTNLDPNNLSEEDFVYQVLFYLAKINMNLMLTYIYKFVKEFLNVNIECCTDSLFIDYSKCIDRFVFNIPSIENYFKLIFSHLVKEISRLGMEISEDYSRGKITCLSEVYDNVVNLIITSKSKYKGVDVRKPNLEELFF